MDAQLLTVLIGRHRSELTFVFTPWFGIPGVGMLFAGSQLTTRSGVGRSLSLVDNIRCLHHQFSDLTVRWHLVGDQRAGDEPDIKTFQQATKKSATRF